LADVEIKWGSSGASIVYEEIKKVSRSVDEVRAKLKSPIGAEMDPMSFGVAAMQQATGSLHALGIEYEKTRGKMKSPLVSPESLMSLNSFTKKGYSRDLKELNDQLGNTGDKARGAGTQLGFVARILAAMSIRAIAREVYEMANAFQTLQNKIKTVTSEDSVNFTMQRLFEAAQNTRTSLESVATAYARTTRSVASLGKSQDEVLRFTENLSKAITVGGSTAVEASNAMIQLSQGMGSGALRGDELRSVLEQLPIVAELIADKMGVPISALRKLGSEGKLSTEVVFEAINAGAAKVDEMFKKMEITVPQAWQRFKNAAIMASESAKGAMGMIAQTIEYVTNHMDTFINVFTTGAVVIGTVFAARAVNMAVEALSGLLSALKMTTAAQTALNVATFANPYVVAAAAAATLAAGLVALTWNMKVLGEDTVTFGDMWTALWEEAKSVFTSNQFEDGIKTVDGSVIGLTESTQDLIRTLAVLMDIMTSIGPAILVKAGISLARWDTDAFSFATDRANSFIDRVNANADNKETDRLLKEEGMVLAEDLSLSAGKSSSSPVLKGADDYINEVKDRIETLEEGGTRALRVQKKLRKILSGMDPSIRDTMSIDQLDTLRHNLEREDDLTHKKSGRGKRDKTFDDIMREAQDNTLMAGMDEKEASVIKKAESLLNQLKEQTRNALSQGQVDQLMAEVRQEQLVTEEKKKQEQLEKDMIEWADKRHKKRLKEEEIINKRASREFNDRNKLDVEMASSLDPEIAVQIEIRKWQEFETRMTRFPDLAEKARRKVRELQDSLALGGLAADYARDIEAIYGVGGSLSKGFSDTAAEILVMNRNLRETKQLFADLAASIAKQAMSRGIQLLVDTGITAIAGGLGGGGGATPGLTVAGTGAATQIDMVTLGRKFASGGYTGDYGVDDEAGIVHGREFVMNASSTASIGKTQLAYMNQTGKMPSTEKAQTSSAAPTINVHNYAGVQVDTQVVSRNEINVMINQAIKEKTPGLVATEVRNPNSRTSRSLARNLETERRRR
jgi:tape measure domain-containing protein